MRRCGSNAIAPGLVDTPWTADWGPIHEAVRRRPSRCTAPPRPTTAPRPLSRMLRNRYMTGATIVVDGGTSTVM